jgi:hypothetical protein
MRSVHSTRTLRPILRRTRSLVVYAAAFEDRDFFGGEHGIEGRGVLRAAVTDDESQTVGPVAKVHHVDFA